MKSILMTILAVMYGFVAPDTVTVRFQVPAGYHQVAVQAGSFAAYLQALPLKPRGTHTHTYKGDIARTDVYTAAVVDMSVGSQDLQQCADAVMRLRGEYLYHQKKYSEISFNFVSGFKCDYIHYADGYRYRNNQWELKAHKDYGYENFMRYMELVFAYAGTPSLNKELKDQSVNELKTGDIFIRGGSPGHCFVVMDVVENGRHQKQFLLAQSFIPAQNIQVLQYDNNPWFSLDRKSEIAYGELIDKIYLKKFD